MNFISTFDELNKLYEEASQPEELTEGKVIDSIKKVATRLGADAATIVRTFAELLPGDAAYEAAVNAENKAVLKALQSGNEKVLNSLTIEDIEELKQDIEDYAKKKSGKVVEEAYDDEEAVDEIEDDETVAEGETETPEEAQFVLECSKCGGLIVKAEADCKVDEAESLANIGDACQYCEATEGYTILGTLVPYTEEEIEIEDDEVVEEGLFDFGKRKKEVAARNAAKAAKFSANRKEAEQKALKDTTVVVQIYRDQSHDPWVEDYYDLAMNAEAAAKRLTNTETDKNIVYRTMSAEQAKNLGAMVNVPERFIAKFLKESTETDCDKDIEEGLLDVSLPVDVDITANGNDVAVGGMA